MLSLARKKSVQLCNSIVCLESFLEILEMRRASLIYIHLQASKMPSDRSDEHGRPESFHLQALHNSITTSPNT